MKPRALDVAIVAAAVLVVGGLALLGHASSQTARSVPSTFDTGRNGYRAWFEVMRAAGVPVRRYGRVVARLDPGVRTLVIAIDEDRMHDPLLLRSGPKETSDFADLLHRFVRDGGRLIEVDTEFAGKSDIAPGAGTSKAAPKGSNGAIAIAKNAQTLGVERVDGPIDAVFPFASSVGVPLLANTNGVVATYSRYGKGEVIAVTAPALFSNAHISSGQNATFAYDIVAGHGPVAFDEYMNGFDEDFCDGNKLLFGLDCLYRSLPQPVQVAAWIAIGIVVLALIGANLPFAPPVPLEAPDERDTSAYLASMGALLRRAHAGAAAAAAFGNDARRRTRGKGSDGATRAFAELERIAADASPTDASVLRAARIDFDLRKDGS